MTIEYEYMMHSRLWGLISQGKFQWFRIDEKRNDREDFISAIKSFIDNWGCAEFRDNTYSAFRVYERTDMVKQELERINENKPRRDVKTPEVYIDTKKELSLPQQAENTVKSKGIPGVCSSPELAKSVCEKHGVPYVGIDDDDEDEF